MRIVQCHGCFDLLHLGHIRHLEAAKQAGDRLIVTVTPDAFVNKGPGRPVFPLAQRMEALRALRCVDAVYSSAAATAAESIRRFKPAIFAKGPDYSPSSLDKNEKLALADVGTELLITNTEKFSSTALLQPREKHAPDVDAYLSALKGKYSAADVLGWLEKARALKVLVVGDAIDDEYVYCNTLGKAGKEPILAAQFVRLEAFVGGAEAVEAHTASVSDHVKLLTGPHTIKRRFVNTYPFQKLFEVYEMNEVHAAQRGDAATEAQAGMVPTADLVIVADYGHGFMTPSLVTMISTTAKYLAVNTQANAGNHGFNTISKYPGPEFVSLSEREMRLDARDQATDIRQLMKCAGDSRRATVLVTRGEHGCVAYQDGAYAEAPALTTHVIDRVGAGDAVFAVTACCAAAGMPLDLLTFMAAVVGSLAVGIVGNARYIERDALHEAITTWLR